MYNIHVHTSICTGGHQRRDKITTYIFRSLVGGIVEIIVYKHDILFCNTFSMYRYLFEGEKKL
jgi:hypothetical protein